MNTEALIRKIQNIRLGLQGNYDYPNYNVIMEILNIIENTISDISIIEGIPSLVQEFKDSIEDSIRTITGYIGNIETNINKNNRDILELKNIINCSVITNYKQIFLSKLYLSGKPMFVPSEKSSGIKGVLTSEGFIIKDKKYYMNIKEEILNIKNALLNIKVNNNITYTNNGCN